MKAQVLNKETTYEKLPNMQQKHFFCTLISQLNTCKLPTRKRKKQGRQHVHIVCLYDSQTYTRACAFVHLKATFKVCIDHPKNADFTVSTFFFLLLEANSIFSNHTTIKSHLQQEVGTFTAISISLFGNYKNFPINYL